MPGILNQFEGGWESGAGAGGGEKVVFGFLLTTSSSPVRSHLQPSRTWSQGLEELFLQTQSSTSPRRQGLGGAASFLL